MKHQAVRGTRDIFLEEAKMFEYLEQVSRKVMNSFGYDFIRTPVFERVEVFTRSLGDSSDIVSKEMYVFKDKGDRLLALKPEGTAPIVRACIENSLVRQNGITKLYYIDSMFRYERPQAGRYRQFYQIGAEAFGIKDSTIDMEIVSIPVKIFKELGIKDATVHINNVGCPECRKDYIKYLKETLEDKKDLICNQCNERMGTNILRIFDCKKSDCKEVLKGVSRITDYLCDKCKQDFNDFKLALKKNNIEYIENHSLVRGLDYYTGSVFEIKTSLLGAQDALAAGGRYDSLVKEMGGSDIPAVGFALGEERVVEVLKKTLDPKILRTNKIFIIFSDKDTCIQNFSLINDLREKGSTVIYDHLFRSIKSQMKQANNMNADQVLILGEDEIKTNTIVVKDMKTGEQETIEINEFQIKNR